MPPKIKISEEDILEKALEIVKEQGMNELNARHLANKLKCSVHPIFRAFQTMDKLFEEVYKKAEEMYNNRLMNALSGKDGFLGMGMEYIHFARDEQNLFKMLFMSGKFKESSIFNMVNDSENQNISEFISKEFSLDFDSAQKVFIGIWLTVHGLASLIAFNGCNFDDNEIKMLLTNSFKGLILNYKEKTHEK